MAGLKCSHCGESIRYHDVPNGIQYTVFTAESWEKIVSTVYDPTNERIHNEWKVPGAYLYRADTIWEDYEDDEHEVWVCPHCGTIVIFDSNRVHVDAVYAPTEDEAPVDEQSVRYVAFSDYIWEKISELSIPNTEIPKRFKPSYVAFMNDEFIWLFDTENGQRCTKVYHRIAVAEEE